jgi:putative sterol carrier protein
MSGSPDKSPFVFPSQEWADAYKDAINASDAYKVAGKDWTFGAVAMVVKADAALGFAEDTALWQDVHQGHCKEAKIVPASEVLAAPFIIIADYARWKSVLRKELDPIKAMMQGKLKLTKGNMPTMVKFVHATKELVEAAARVPTKFKDE